MHILNQTLSPHLLATISFRTVVQDPRDINQLKLPELMQG